MPELPSASVTIDDEAGAFAGGTGYCVVLSCVGKNADLTPRVFASAKALLAQHDYSQGADYAALHIEKTKKPVIFVGLPVATVGVITPDVTGVVGTSVVSATAAAAGVMEEVNGSLQIVNPGVVGTSGITALLSLDGGRSFQTIRLGTANSYVIPYVGITLHFAAGTLLANDVFRFTSTAPMWDAAGLTAARTALARQQKLARTWLICGDLPNSGLASNVVTEVNAYETANDRFVVARVSVRDRHPLTETMAQWISAMDAAFAIIDAQRRIDLSAGRLYKQSPIHGWQLRRAAAWAASVREYEHDVQIPTYRKADGPLDEWSLEDLSGHVVEYDDRSDGGALAARFTCARTFSNGPIGAFIALSLTRAPEASLLSRTHNMAVANVACSVCQAETENAIGQVLVLNKDGTGTAASLALIQGRVNTALEVNLLQDKGEGPRASMAVWTASTTDILDVPGAELTGSLQLLINGTLEKISTRVRIQTAGA